MKEITGNIFEVDADAICVTTNGVVKNNGELVMGAGIAKQFAERYPGLAKYLGECVKEHGNVPCVCFIRAPRFLTNSQTGESYENPAFEGRALVSLPTKWHWTQSSDMSLIIKSLEMLVIEANARNWKKIVLPRPGCGLGGLKWEVVKAVIEPILDDRFYIITPEGGK